MVGVYSITNKITGQKYIGESTNVGSRWITHICELTRNTHYNYKLQSDWNRYGFDNFEFEVLEWYPILNIDEYKYNSNIITMLLLREHYYMSTNDNLYNIENTLEKVMSKMKDVSGFNFVYAEMNMDYSKSKHTTSEIFKAITQCDIVKYNAIHDERPDNNDRWYAISQLYEYDELVEFKKYSSVVFLYMLKSYGYVCKNTTGTSWKLTDTGKKTKMFDFKKLTSQSKYSTIFVNQKGIEFLKTMIDYINNHMKDNPNYYYLSDDGRYLLTQDGVQYFKNLTT